jgi:hypothetical protein
LLVRVHNAALLDASLCAIGTLRLAPFRRRVQSPKDGHTTSRHPVPSKKKSRAAITFSRRFPV